jgi:hypothetical protein
METFTAHEPPVPDTVDMLSSVNAIAKAHRRNRWALRVTGISLVSAGIVAGSMGLPGLLSAGPGGGNSSLTAATGGKPAADASPGSYTDSQKYAEFFNDGYDYGNAVALAKLWNMTDASINTVKAKAGQELLEGNTLPVQPDNAPVTPADQKAEKAAQAFFNAGYDYADAQTLAGMWHTSPYAAKVKAGQDVEDGKPVPIQPTGAATNDSSRSTAGSPAAAKARALHKSLVAKRLKPGGSSSIAVPQSATDGEGPALTAYFSAGYDYANAQQLARLWHESNVDQVKAQAGHKLLNGDSLPVSPDGTPASPENKAVAAFFGAGYDYNDAVKLGKMWSESPYQAKIDGGTRIENGQQLPVTPGG